MKCKNCDHELIRHENPKTKKITWYHYNRYYFGFRAINHKWCSQCEVSTEKFRTFKMDEVCKNPEPK